MGDRHFTAKEELTLMPPPAEKGTEVFLEVAPASSTSPVWPTPLASFLASPCAQKSKEKRFCFSELQAMESWAGPGNEATFCLRPK